MKRICLIFSIFLSVCINSSAQDTWRDTTGFKTALSGNAADLLRGEVAGVRVSSTDGNPNGAVNVNIRGVNTLRTDNQPLWIVDGTMLSTELNQYQDAFWQYGFSSYTTPLNPLSFLDPNQIESIEILKDASATAIYGAKGANGVIIVTTKKSMEGSRKFKLTSHVGLVANSLSLSHNHFLAFGGSRNNIDYNISGTFRGVNGGTAGNTSGYGSVKADFETKANRTIWFKLHTLLSAGRTSSASGTNYLGEPSMTLAMRDASLSPFTTVDQWKKDYDDLTEDYRALVSAEMQINFTQWLYARLYGGFDFNHNTRILWYGKGTSFGCPSLWNPQGGVAGNIMSRLFSANANIELGLNRYVAKDHHFQFHLNGAYNGDINDFNTMNGNNFVIDLLRGKGINTGAFEIRHHRFERSYTHFGAYGVFAYDYKDIAGVNASLRWDTTPRYGREENHLYPAAKAYFDISKLAFKDNPVFSTLRIEGGYGISGLEKSLPYELTGNYLSGDWYQPTVPGTAVFFDGLNRSRTAEWTISLTAGFWKDRLRISAGWFDRKTDDDFLIYQLGEANGEIDEKQADAPEIWNWSGCKKVFERNCRIGNRGYEFSLSAKPVSSGDWTWNISANLTLLENKLIKADPADFYGKAVGHDDLLDTDVLVNSNIAGLQAGSFYGYRNGADGAYLDITGEGIIDDYDKVYLGRAIPTLYGGIQTSLRFKGLTLELSFDGAAGHKVANLQNIANDWSVDDNGNVVISEKYLESGDWFRLSSAGLKYNIPVKAKWISDLSVRFACNNLFTVTKYGGWNPDVNCFGNGALSPGIDYGSHPVFRTFLFGISAKF